MTIKYSQKEILKNYPTLTDLRCRYILNKQERIIITYEAYCLKNSSQKPHPEQLKLLLKHTPEIKKLKFKLPPSRRGYIYNTETYFNGDRFITKNSKSKNSKKIPIPNFIDLYKKSVPYMDQFKLSETDFLKINKTEFQINFIAKEEKLENYYDDIYESFYTEDSEDSAVIEESSSTKTVIAKPTSITNDIVLYVDDEKIHISEEVLYLNDNEESYDIERLAVEQSSITKNNTDQYPNFKDDTDDENDTLQDQKPDHCLLCRIV